METTEKTGLLSNILGDVKVNTNVGVTQSDLFHIGVTLFVASCLIMLAWFTFKKLYN